MSSSSTEPLPYSRWLFAYGSLIWRPDFEPEATRRGYVRGWARRFFQGSEDHRGVPGSPGRVVTLVPNAGARCWGKAYLLSERHWQRVVSALDVREQGGYRQLWLPFHAVEPASSAAAPEPGPPAAQALVYVATEHNPHYLGPAPLEEMARQIAVSHGPSGSNADYVLLLDEALRSMRCRDPHVQQLAARVRDLKQATAPPEALHEVAPPGPPRGATRPARATPPGSSPSDRTDRRSSRRRQRG